MQSVTTAAPQANRQKLSIYLLAFNRFAVRLKMTSPITMPCASPVAQAANVDQYSYLNLPPLCRITDLLPVVPIKRSTVWLWVRTGRFPAPIRPFGKFCTVWRREDVLAWLSKAGA